MNFLTQSFIALAMLFTAILPSQASVKTDLLVAQTTVCSVSEDAFYDSVKNLNATIFVASDTARESILHKINTVRKGLQLWEFEADKLAIGIFTDKGQRYVGIVMFKDHCVVPGSVKVFPLSDWVAFVEELGLTMEEFTQERSS